MNRIRKVNNTYQVLVNQNYRTNPSIELTLGSLLAEEYLRDYELVEFDNINDAMKLAFNLPAISFKKIVSDCIDCYKILDKEITNTLSSLIITYYPHLLSPEELKTAIFDRVGILGQRFTLYNFNDVIAFDIVVNYCTEVNKISNLLKLNKKLRIMRIEKTRTHTKLIGLTENNITYEIRLWVHKVYDFMRWIYYNNKNINDYLIQLKELINKEYGNIN